MVVVNMEVPKQKKTLNISINPSWIGNFVKIGRKADGHTFFPYAIFTSRLQYCYTLWKQWQKNYKALRTTTTLLLQLYLTNKAIWHGKASLGGKIRNEQINLSRREKLIYNWLVRNYNMKSQQLTNSRRHLPNKSARDTVLLVLNKETIQ